MPDLPAPSDKEDLNKTKFRPFPFSPALENLTPHPEDLELPPPVDEHDDGDRPRAMIGTTDGVEIWFDPDYPKQRLANAHISITGESGSGKTQSMKTIIADLWTQGVPALILDFKDDYADQKYAAEGRFTVYDPTKAPLPINPLTPPSDPQTDQVNVVFHAYQVAEIVSRIYGLGEIQAFRLREAIKEIYQDAGLPGTLFVPDKEQTWPLFQGVREKLATNKDNNELLGHLSPIFDFGFFSSTDAKGFAGIAERNTVIRLGQLPGNEIKNTVAEFFLMSMYNHLISMPQMHVLDRILVLDEAWRLVNSPFLEPLMREGRAFGLGIFVATQFPTDLPLAVSGSTATQMFFSQTSPSQIIEIKRIVAGNTSSTVADQLDKIIRAMPPMTCVLHNKQYRPFARVEARPYYQRNIKTASFGYMCTHCQNTTNNIDKICDNCKRIIDDSLDISSNTQIPGYGASNAVGSGDAGMYAAKILNQISGWRKKKKAELQPFPPGEEEEEGDPFAPIQERFVESPRNKRPT